jgi:hypothetical protein
MDIALLAAQQRTDDLAAVILMSPILIVIGVWAARQLHRNDAWNRLWEEMADPLSYSVGAATLLFSKRDRRVIRASRLGSALVLAVMLILFAVVSGPGLGNVAVYAGTLAVAGMLTLLPGRIAELRHQGRLGGSGYPKNLRKAMAGGEAIVIVVFIATYRVARDLPAAHGIAAGAAFVSYGDLIALFFALIIAGAAQMLEEQ